MANANKELKKIMNDFNETYKRVCAQSRDEYIKSLGPGAMIPNDGPRIYTENGKNFFTEECRKYKAKAHEIIDAQINDLKNKITEAPSTEAVNSITLLKLRDSVTEKEISDLMERYGDNVQAYKALNSIAYAHDIKSFGDHPLCDRLDNVEALSASIDKTLVPWNNHISDGFIGFFNMDIDSVFPAEGSDE
jgi:hypothetical protein